MPRRGNVVKRVIAPDPQYSSEALAKFINRILRNGKKTVAQEIVYQSFGIIEKTLKRNPLEVFEQAIQNARPLLVVRPRRVGGATYQVPMEVGETQGVTLAHRWLIQFSKARSGRSMAEKLAAELIDAYHGTGATIKKREDTHRMAEANKAFAHYRW